MPLMLETSCRFPTIAPLLVTPLELGLHKSPSPWPDWPNPSPESREVSTLLQQIIVFQILLSSDCMEHPVESRLYGTSSGVKTVWNIQWHPLNCACCHLSWHLDFRRIPNYWFHPSPIMPYYTLGSIYPITTITNRILYAAYTIQPHAQIPKASPGLSSSITSKLPLIGVFPHCVGWISLSTPV